MNRVFAIACNHLDVAALQAEIVNLWMSITGGKVPTCSLETDKPDDIEAAAQHAFVFVPLVENITPELLITDSIDIVESVPIDTGVICIDPSLAYDRLALIVCNTLIAHIQETRDGSKH